MRRLLPFFILLAAFASAAPATDSRPNILFVILDDWGWNHAGILGCRWIDTPNFDRVAREGVLFTHCFTSNPKCSPSRASILTGRNAWQLAEGMNHNGAFPAGLAVFPDLLEAAGYTIGLTGKGWAPGDYTVHGRTRNPAGPSFDQRKHVPVASGISRNDYAANFADFLAARSPGHPFCFWMGIYEPHRRYEPGSGRRLGKSPAAIDVPPYLPDVPAVRDDFADYAIEVESADAQLGRALALLEKFGELDRTLIVVTSDNGMPFPYVKGQIHEDGFRLPLAIRWPARVASGRTFDGFINVRDFAPTFLDAAGVAVPDTVTGHSFLDTLLGRPGSGSPDAEAMLTGKERHDVGRPHDWGYPVRAIRTGDWLYVHNFFPDRWPAGDPGTGYLNCDDSPTKSLVLALGGYYADLSFGRRPMDELYRLSDDPHTVRNLASDPAFAGVLAGLRSELQSRLTAESDPRALGHGEIFDSYPYLGHGRGAYDRWLARQTSAIKAGNPPATAPGSTAESP